MAALTDLSVSSLSSEGRSALATVGELGLGRDTYLAGSAALTLHLGHRRVRDLDFMSTGARLVSPERRDLLAAYLAHDPQGQVETARDGYLFLRAGNGAGLRFYHYPYPLVEATSEIEGVEVAGLLDLGLMKLGAIISRSLPHDFVDFYWVARRLGLAEILARSEDKFAHVRDFPLQALKALAAIPTQPDEPIPQTSPPTDWLEVRRWVEHEVAPYSRRYVGLEEARR
ncbi:MAG TPA: hypothetical protein VKA53_03120 [Thermoanaerobaculia bacterium]|nr:hypothetical protein [Thermoanaerobaculia bacterium]